MENIRIDKGIKRKLRKEARDNPLTKTTRVWTKYDPAQREQIIKALPQAIIEGMTTNEFAAKHNIPASTLKSWVLGNDEVEGARGLMLSSELTLRMQEIEDSQDALALARAREGFRAWSWIAERREHRLYGQRSHVAIENQPLNSVDKTLLGDAQELLRIFKAKTIEAEPVVQLPVDKSED